EIVPAEQTRFLFVRPRPESAIDFDPEGTDAVPRLFDEFDRLGAATAGREVKGELPSGFDAIFRYSLLDPAADLERTAGAFRPAFAEAAAHGDAPATGEQWQAAIFAVAADHGVDAKAAFNALYFAFLGRPNGPRAGWLLASLEREFVVRRLREAGQQTEAMA